jgi:glycerol-3-phosphate dehydrogenase
MAQKLSDVIFRRTELGTAGYPGDACLRTCAEIMAGELGWQKKRMFQELDEVHQAFCDRA